MMYRILLVLFSSFWYLSGYTSFLFNPASLTIGDSTALSSLLYARSFVEVKLLGGNAVKFSVFPAASLQPPLRYSWMGNGNISLHRLADSSFVHYYPQPGVYSYQLEITDRHGKQQQLNGKVKIDKGAIAEAGNDLIACKGGVYTLGGTRNKNHDYRWFPIEGLDNPFVANPNFQLKGEAEKVDTIRYRLEVKKGRYITYDYVNVMLMPTPDLSIVTARSEICEGDAVVLKAKGGHTYQWSTGDTTANIIVHPQKTTTYSVLGSKAGCKGEKVTTKIEVTSRPDAAIAGDTLLCAMSMAQLWASGAESYQWHSGEKTMSIGLAIQEEITPVYVIPYNKGCQGDTVFTRVQLIPKPKLAVSISGYCEGIPTSFEVFTDGTEVWKQIIWDFGDPASGKANYSTDTKVSHVFSRAGNFMVRLIASNQAGCRDTIVKEVEIYPIPWVDFDTSPVCVGDTVSFQSSVRTSSLDPIATYQWNFSDQHTSEEAKPKHIFEQEGNYWVSIEVTSQHACKTKQKRRLTVNPSASAHFEVLQACENQLLLKASDTLSQLSNQRGLRSYIEKISWDIGGEIYAETNPVSFLATFSELEKTDYAVTLKTQTNQGCIQEYTQQIKLFSSEHVKMILSPEIVFLPDAEVEFRTASFLPIRSWSWDFGDENMSQDEAPIHNYDSVGKYEVNLIATSLDGCKLSFSQIVKVQKVSGISLPPAFSPNGDGVNDLLIIKHLDIFEFQLQIYNEAGQLVYHSDDPDKSWDGKDLNGTQVESGIYVCIIEAMGGDGRQMIKNQSLTLIR